MQKIISAVSELLERLKSYGEDGTAAKHTVTSNSYKLLATEVDGLNKGRVGCTSLHVGGPKTGLYSKIT